MNINCNPKSMEKETPTKPHFNKRLSVNKNKSGKEKQKDRNSLLLEYVEKILSDPTNESVTKKFISIPLANQEINVRTADNVGLAQCIFVNFMNPVSKYPYAISADCYCVFCDFFGPLVEFIHGQTQSEACLEPIYGDVDKYEFVDLNLRERSRVIYAEITLRRNLEKYPFTPMMSSSNRKQLIDLLEKRFRKICENQKEIVEIPLEWEDKFDKIKNELDDIGAMENYPNDRLHLIFQTENAINLGMVLNFDDHMQIIVCSYDGRIGKLYHQMYEIYTNENLDKLDFVAHPYLGFLTLSPNHIGTGFIIRIIAKFPFLCQIVNSEMWIVKTFDLIVEPENPECPYSGLLNIYNKKTLNKSEEEIFNDIINGFNGLCDLEQELETTTPMAAQNGTMPVESLQCLVDMINKSESRSFTKKYLTSNIVSQYTNVKTGFGNLLNHCIRGNAFHSESLHPRSTDSDAYTTFRLFFTPILYEINKVNSTSHSIQPHYGIASDNTQYMIRHPDILSFRVRFVRNFQEYAFPNAMSKKERKEIEQIMIRTFEEFPLEIEGIYIPLNQIKTSMYYDDIILHKLLPNSSLIDNSWGYCRDWPHYRGIFFICKDCKYPELISLIYINFTEHLKIVCLDPTGKNLHSCYDRAVLVMQFLDLRFEKMFARKLGYGFLTSFPQSVGCGLRISAKVLLKNLGENREVLERKCQAFQFAYRGTNGCGTPAINNVFDISFILNMNVKERFILLSFCQRLKELILAEREYDTRIPKPSNEIFFEEDDTFNEEFSENNIKSESEGHAEEDDSPSEFIDVDKESSVYSSKKSIRGSKIDDKIVGPP